ncbi:MAG TPA: hypothetical protein VHC00_05535 [Rhizobiaceae bacterium]|nr:hypothetical protein [Rhizobiaceae bacterium]
MPKDNTPGPTPAEIDSDIHRLTEMEKDTNPETRNRIDREIEELRKEKEQIDRGRRS